MAEATPTATPTKGKKLPPWAMGLGLAGAGLVIYYFYKKSHESGSGGTPEFYPAATGGASEFPGGGGGVGGGTSSGEGAIIGLIQSQEAENAKIRKEENEARATAEGKMQTFIESMITNSQAAEKAFIEAWEKSHPPPTTTPATTTTTTPTTTTTTTPSGTTPVPVVSGQAPPAPGYGQPIQTTTVNPVTGGTVAPGGTGSCTTQYPLQGPHGCFRRTTRNGCECHQYKNGTLECQHRNAKNVCVW